MTMRPTVLAAASQEARDELLGIDGAAARVCGVPIKPSSRKEEIHATATDERHGF
jgi:hypothetical protein